MPPVNGDPGASTMPLPRAGETTATLVGSKVNWSVAPTVSGKPAPLTVRVNCVPIVGLAVLGVTVTVAASTIEELTRASRPAHSVVIDFFILNPRFSGANGRAARLSQSRRARTSCRSRLALYSDFRNTISAARSAADIVRKDSLAGPASPSCQRMASSRVRARPSCR